MKTTSFVELKAYANFEGKPTPSYVSYLTFHVEEILHVGVTSILCKLLGHSFQDTSFGGPEGGYVEVTCSRCGHSTHTTLY